jgi:SAM-dependent methyltransferase
MTTPLTYDFGYSWPIVWGPLIPLAVFGALAIAGARFKWRRWLVIASSAVAAWALAGLLILHFLLLINLPMSPQSDQFLASGSGRVVDIGAGSGRATVGLLLVKPRVTVTAIDIYKGYFGIEGNTPERLMHNARIAGVADRAVAKIGDARDLPLEDATYDGAISVAAIDHLPRAGIPKALAEVARVLKPGGEFLLTLVNVDAWIWLASPPMAHMPSANPDRWRTLLESAGFEIVEAGTQPGSVYFLSRKPRP